MMILKAMKDTRTIEAITVGITGTVKIQAKSYMKLKLKIAWLRADSTPPHLANATISVIRVIAANGARI